MRSLGLDAADVSEIINPDPFSMTARTFLVRTRDGQRLKVRRNISPKGAERAIRLAARMSDPRLPVPVGRHGRVTVEQWVEGQALSSLPPRKGLVEAAADLLASIHQFPGTPGRRLPQARSLDPFHATIERFLSRCHDLRVLEPAITDALQALLSRALPARAPWGLVHNDFAGTNLILDPDGQLVSIDNEHLGWGFLDADLARVWARWPLPEPMSQHFEARYAAQTGREISPEERAGWRAAAAFGSVAVRAIYGGPIEGPLARLVQTLASAG